LSTDVAVPGQEKHEKLRQLVRVLDIEAGLPDNNNSDEFVYDVMESILNAENAEEAFNAQEAGTLSGKDFVNTPFYLRSDDVTWLRSRQFDNTGGKVSGFPFYAMLTVREVATGDEQVVSCGGMTFVAVLRKLQEVGYLDKNAEGASLVLTAKATASGNAILFLKPYNVAKRPSKNGSSS
jgi:hypothetical protein